MARYGIAEWFGRKVGRLAVFERQSLVEAALGQGAILIYHSLRPQYNTVRRAGLAKWGFLAKLERLCV